MGINKSPDKEESYSVGINSPRFKKDCLNPSIQTVTDDGKVNFTLQERKSGNIEVRIMLDPSTREKQIPINNSKGVLHYRIDDKTVYAVPIQMEKGFGAKIFQLPPEIAQLTNNPERISYLLEINKDHDAAALLKQTQKAIMKVIRSPEYLIKLNSPGQTGADDGAVSLTVSDDHFNKFHERKINFLIRYRLNDPALANCRGVLRLIADDNPEYSFDFEIKNGIAACKITIPSEIAEKTRNKSCSYVVEIFRKL